MKILNYVFMFLMSMMFIGCGEVSAQVDPEQAASMFKPVIEFALTYLPESALGIIVLIGGFRVLFKPLMALLEAIAIYTPTKKDDEIYKNISEGNAYKTIRFIFDFIASIKLPQKKK